MFRITENPSSGSLVQSLAKNYKNGSIMYADMDMVIFSQTLYKTPWCWILCDLKHAGALLNIL